jgi:hypothetical protein
VIGLCVFRILAPAPRLILDNVLDPANIPATSTTNEEQSDSQFYGEVTKTLIDGIRADRRWTNWMSLFFFVSALSLVVEITLIAIHFKSSTGYRVAIGLVVLPLLVLFATKPLQDILAIIRRDEGTILPYGVWRFFLRIPVARRWMSRAVLGHAVPVAPLRVAVSPPRVRFERPSGAGTREEAISHQEGALTAFRESHIYALGEPSGDVRPGVSGTESDLLHFTADVAGREAVFLPVFTGLELMREPLEKNREWQTLSVLEIDGGALLDAADDDVTIIINPWSEKELQIPPDQRRDIPRPDHGRSR